MESSIHSNSYKLLIHYLNGNLLQTVFLQNKKLKSVDIQGFKLFFFYEDMKHIFIKEEIIMGLGVEI